MKRQLWDHKVVTGHMLPGGWRRFESQGWELVTVCMNYAHNGNSTYFFKRKKNGRKKRS